MKQKLLFLSVFLFSIIILSQFVSAIPELPMIVSGDVSINDKPAKIGTQVSAEVNGKEITSMKTTEAGKFTLLLQKLNENDNAEFYVDGIDSGQNVIYKSGDFKQLNLKVEKSYLIYYIAGGIAILTIILIIWTRKHH